MLRKLSVLLIAASLMFMVGCDQFFCSLFPSNDSCIVEVCVDIDEDGYGSPASSACDYPELDCDDDNALVNPGAAEVCSDGIDTNCDGVADIDDPDCSITYDLAASGNIVGTYPGIISNFTGTAMLDLTSGDLNYEYSDALVNIANGAFVFITSESGTISGTWDEASMTLEVTSGSGTVDTCANTTGDVCEQWLADPDLDPDIVEYPIPSGLASGIVGSIIDFSLGTLSFTTLYNDPIYTDLDITINFELTELTE